MKSFTLQFILAGIIAGVLITTTGCKKNDTTTPTFQLTTLADSTDNEFANFTYDANGNLIVFYDNSVSYNFYYSGNNVIKRTYTTSGTLTNIDSFFYDTQNHLIEVVEYDGSNNKQDSTLFTYNGDNTINAATKGYISPSNNSELHEYSYTNGKLTERDDYVNISGDFKINNQYQFLGYDGKSTPFNALAHLYLPDQFSLFFFVWCGPGNTTSVKESTYDTNTGNISSVISVTAAYQYNTGGLPVKAIFDQGGTSIIYTFGYQQK